MRLTRRDAWLVRRLLGGADLNGDAATASPEIERLLANLADQSVETRLTSWGAVMASLSTQQAADIIQQLASVDPMERPQDEDEPEAFYSTLEDVARVSEGVRWLWPGWIPSGRICGLAALEGIGKTRLLLDLCRRAYLGEPWPDGQPASLPVGTKSLWLCADGHQSELAETASAFGLPLEAVVLPAPPEQPFDGTSLDDADTLAVLQKTIQAVKPGIVVVDTLTFATQRDLCRQNDLAALRDPLVQLAQDNGLAVLLALHVNAAGVAFGRRIRGLTRTLMHLEQPDPDGQPGRLRFWLEKSYSAKPPAIGVTLGPNGNQYDYDPPDRVDSAGSKGGRPAGARGKAEKFILDTLTAQNDRKTTDLRYAWEKDGGSVSSFYSARDALVDAGRILEDGKPKILHLYPVPEDDEPGTF